MIIEERSKHSAVFNKKRDLCDLRVLRGPEPAFYIICLKLSSVQAANSFVREFHQQRFNQMEPDLCEVFVLDSVTYEREEEAEEQK